MFTASLRKLLRQPVPTCLYHMLGHDFGLRRCRIRQQPSIEYQTGIAG